MQKPSLAAMLLGTLLAPALAGCGADPARRYDASDAQMRDARAGAQQILHDQEAKLRDAASRSEAATEAYRRTADRVFAADRLDRKRHPERYRGHAPPPSLAYERTMSGENDREDDAERQYERDRLRAVQDAASGDMEWEIERGQVETRHGRGVGIEREGVWPDDCASRRYARRSIDCGD